MSEKERENIVSLVSTILVSFTYFIYVYQRYQNSTMTMSEELVYWASAILILIPIRIALHIVITIIFAILHAIFTGKEEEFGMTDERDKLIELKGDRITTNTFMFGFLIAMIGIVNNASLSFMFIVMMLSATLGEVIGNIAKIIYYRIGV